MVMRNNPLLLLVLLGALSGCNQEARTGHVETVDEAKVDQSVYCQAKIESLFAAPQCEPGQKIAFLPDAYGNEQLPILFAAKNCDLRYSVALTRGGVVCIYRPSTEKKQESLTEKNDGSNGS